MLARQNRPLLTHTFYHEVAKQMLSVAGQRWTISDSAELYELPRWGNDYFSISEKGNLLVHPQRQPGRSVDLKHVIDQLREGGMPLPILVRFSGILADRLQQINQAFSRAISEFEYTGRYSLIYPVKVNQQRPVVEQVLQAERRFGGGLEAGSKAELVAVLALADDSTPVICNGFKDAAFIELALLARKIGKQVIPVVEKFSDLEMIVRLAKQLDVQPVLGMRVKLAAVGSGRWQASGGYRSKFGLTVHEVLRGLSLLKEHGMSDCFQLLHFHLGSQITNIRFLKGALTESARIYADLFHRGAGLKALNVGGGLGVDYDGSQTDFASSMNYSLQEYANDVVYYIQQVCDDADVPHPNILSESGRAVAAYHSVLVFNVLDTHCPTSGTPKPALPEGSPPTLVELHEVLDELNSRNLLESLHDAEQAIDMTMSLFSMGHVSLEERSEAETIYRQICREIQRLAEQLEDVPEELGGLNRLLSDIYFCNFSLFRSIPDSWAIKQLFPIMPIHRLDQRPTRHAVLADITCDSDGKVDQFVHRREVQRTILLHELTSDPYHLAVFLTGAYQEILGDLHNLFGCLNSVDVEVDERGEIEVHSRINGHSVREVLELVQYSPDKLAERMQAAARQAVSNGIANSQEAERVVEMFRTELKGYTYPNNRSEKLYE